MEGAGYQIFDGFTSITLFQELQLEIKQLQFSATQQVGSRADNGRAPPPQASIPMLLSALNRSSPFAKLGYAIRHAIDQSGLIPNFKEKSWDVGLRVYLHGNGGRVLPHTDAPKFLGAAVFYAHPEWKQAWGGELCFPSQGSNSAIYRTQDNLLQEGTGIYISPIPNRLIVINPNAIHFTNPVGSSENIRHSITAFVLPVVENEAIQLV